MEALGMCSITARIAIACGFRGTAEGSHRRYDSAETVSSSSSPQFCHGQEKPRNLAVASESASAGAAVAGGGRSTTEAGGFVRDSSRLVLASLAAGLANVQSAVAVSYDEVVGRASEAAPFSTDVLSFDTPEVDSSAITDFASSNPLAILGGGVVLVLPLIVTTILTKSKGYGHVSAKEAFAKLGDEELVSQILDIRVGDDVRSEGTPNLKVYKKKVTQLPYNSEPAEYLSKVLKKFKDAENSTIYVLDRFDGNSSTVAKLLAKGGFKAAYAIKDGAEGPSGWQPSGLPWLVPSRRFSLDLGSFKELLSTSDTGNIVPTALGVAAAAGIGLVVFSEAETALQLLGSAAVVQLFLKKLLFAEDRKKTIEELKTFLDTKVAPKELVAELKGIAEVLLPKFEEVQPASMNGAATLESADVEADMPTSVESASTSSTELPWTPKALSPYAQYPGLKPPTSPAPSRPGVF